MTVERLGPGRYGPAARLYRQVRGRAMTPRTLERKYAGGPEPFRHAALLARMGGEPAAFFGAVWHPIRRGDRVAPAVQIVDLYTRSDLRRRGLAGRLISEMELVLREAGASHVVAFPNRSSQRALRSWPWTWSGPLRGIVAGRRGVAPAAALRRLAGGAGLHRRLVRARLAPRIVPPRDLDNPLAGSGCWSTAYTRELVAHRSGADHMVVRHGEVLAWVRIWSWVDIGVLSGGGAGDAVEAVGWLTRLAGTLGCRGVRLHVDPAWEGHSRVVADEEFESWPVGLRAMSGPVSEAPMRAQLGDVDVF